MDRDRGSKWKGGRRRGLEESTKGIRREKYATAGTVIFAQPP